MVPVEETSQSAAVCSPGHLSPPARGGGEGCGCGGTLGGTPAIVSHQTLPQFSGSLSEGDPLSVNTRGGGGVQRAVTHQEVEIENRTG